MPNKCPEYELQPDLYYNEKEAYKYSQNSHIIEVQTKLAERALELCNISQESPALVLDIGCGSGLSGEVIKENGHIWLGFDISQAMLDIAHDRDDSGNLVLGDMGEGLSFKPGIFDACISVSALQWLCNSYTTHQIPSKRLFEFFASLYACMAHGSRAVFQFYPNSHQQIELIQNAAIKAGFTGGIVVDFPNSTRAKKMYLCLFVGISAPTLPQGNTDACNINVAKFVNDVGFGNKRKRVEKAAKKSKKWINDKKEVQFKKGADVRPFSKYSSRKRRSRF